MHEMFLCYDYYIIHLVINLFWLKLSRCIFFIDNFFHGLVRILLNYDITICYYIVFIILQRIDICQCMIFEDCQNICGYEAGIDAF